MTSSTATTTVGNSESEMSRPIKVSHHGTTIDGSQTKRLYGVISLRAPSPQLSDEAGRSMSSCSVESTKPTTATYRKRLSVASAPPPTGAYRRVQ